MRGLKRSGVSRFWSQPFGLLANGLDVSFR
jgi:hypothetical protein